MAFAAQGLQDVDFPMFRYADALLMLAECYQEVGGGDPVALLEQVRARALSGPGIESGSASRSSPDHCRRAPPGAGLREPPLV